MTRVLMISYCFAPQNQIGAVRPTKLAKYLARMGCEVTVLCGEGLEPGRVDPTLKRDLAELRDVRVVHAWNPLTWVRMRLHGAKGTTPEQAASSANTTISGASDDRKGVKSRALDALFRWLRRLGDLNFQRTAKRELRKLGGCYDAVFSSYGPLSVHEIARVAKRRGLAKKWIADFRDEVTVDFGWQEGYKRRYLQTVAREADLITAATNGFLSMMGLNGRMLSNGFDREDMPASVERDEDGCFRVVYCGQLGEGRKGVPARDVTPCFRALRALVDESLIAKDKLSLVYAGNKGELFRKYAASVGLEDRVNDLGTVSRERSLALQAGADLLLMASVNSKNQYGILTGKLFEYLMMQKPIVCCMGGDMAGSEMKRVLTETGAGFCWEEADAQADSPALESWLHDIIIAWRQDLDTSASKENKQIEAYTHPQLASTLLNWIHE